MGKTIGMISACAHRLYLYRPELLDRIRAEGYEVIVFGPEPQRQGDEGLNPNGIRYIELPLERRRTDPFAERNAARLLVDEIEKNGIGLLFSYGIRFSPLVNNAAKRTGIPCMNVINGAGSLFISGGIRGKVKRLLILPYIRASIRYSSRIVFQNSDDRALFSSLRLGMTERYLSVRGSGVNTDRFPVFPLPQNRVFGYLSRMNPEKGIDELLRAFEAVLEDYPDTRLRLAGEQDGIQETATQQRLERLCDRGSVEYLGEISDVPGFLKTIRYFVFPSYREGTPRATLEAMSCGRPVITTDVPGCRETVKDGYNGILVPVRNAEALAEAMKRFCKEDETAERMGKNARLFVEENFDVFSVNEKLVNEIKKLY